MTNLQSKKSSEAHRKSLEKEEAIKTKEKIEKITLKIPVKSGENGKIFGGVTSKEIAQNLEKEYKIKVDKKKIVLQETIKVLGAFNIEIKLYDDVTATLKLNVISQ